jgi:hypothetical protein
MNVKTSIRTLAGAALVALAVAGMAANPAGAERNTGGTNDTNCAATGATLVPPSDIDVEFFPPGEKVVMKDSNGTLHTMQCGSGGVWNDVTRMTPRRGLPGGISVTNIPGGRRR